MTPAKSSPDPFWTGMTRDEWVAGPTGMPTRLSASSSPVSASPMIRYHPSSLTLGNLHGQASRHRGGQGRAVGAPAAKYVLLYADLFVFAADLAAEYQA